MKKIKSLFSLSSLFSFGDFQLINKMKKIKKVQTLFSLFTFGDFQLTKKMKKIKSLWSLFFRQKRIKKTKKTKVYMFFLDSSYFFWKVLANKGNEGNNVFIFCFGF